MPQHARGEKKGDAKTLIATWPDGMEWAIPGTSAEDDANDKSKRADNGIWEGTKKPKGKPEEKVRVATVYHKSMANGSRPSAARVNSCS